MSGVPVVVKWITILIVVIVIGGAAYDYVSTKQSISELETSNKLLQQSNENYASLLEKIESLNKIVQESDLRAQKQSAALDKVARDIKRVKFEASKDATYREFIATPLHAASLRMFSEARNGDSDAVQDKTTVAHTGEPVAGRATSAGTGGR